MRRGGRWWAFVSTRGKSRREAAGFAGAAMENGGRTAGGTDEERQGTLSPAPLLKGLRPLRIPLMQRIACAARGEYLRFYLGPIPPNGGGIGCFFVESSCEKVVLGKGHVPREKVSACGERFIFQDTPPPQPCAAGNPPSPNPSFVSQTTLRRRIQTLCRRQPPVAPPQPGVVGDPPSPRPSFVWQTARRHPRPARRRGRPSVAHDSCQLPISQPKTANPAVVRRDLPRVETKYLEFPPRCACASRAVGFQRVSDPLAGVQGAAPPARPPWCGYLAYL